MQQTLHESCI